MGRCDLNRWVRKFPQHKKQQMPMGYNHGLIIQAASNRKQKNRQMEIKENAKNKVNILIYIWI